MALHEIYKGMHIDGLILEKNDAMDIYADGFVTNVSVNSGGSIDIYSGGTATRTTVNKGGGLYISSGGTATAIKENGGFVSVYGYNTYVTFVPSTIDGITLSSFMTVHSNTVANDTSIYNSGAVYIHSGGIADKTTVNSGGYMAIYSGGTATNTTANKGGWMDIYSGGTATIKENGGHVDVEKGANVTFVPNTIDNLTLSMHELMTVHKNTVAYNTTLDGWGHMEIFSGGVAEYTTVNIGGDMKISSGGVANNTSVDRGLIEIYSGGIANHTNVEQGDMCLGEYYYDYTKGGTANYTTVNSRGNIYIHSKGVANYTTINSDGDMAISSGGTAIYTTVNKGGYMETDGTASNTIVNLGGRVEISSGSIHRGTLQIANGAVVSAFEKSKIDFTVADRTPSDGYLINNLSLIEGAPTYTITVSENQEYGTYKLAQGANDFTTTLAIGRDKKEFGKITVNGDYFVYNGVTYSLNEVGGDLTLTITGEMPVVIKNDLDGNGLADTVLVHTKQGFSGAWMTTGTKSVIKWGDLGNVNGKVELVGMGNVKGTTEEGSDIYLKIGTTVAAWVTDKGKVKSYKELYTLKSNMNMLGIGDFDGDGVTDYLLRSKTGDLGYVTGDDNNWHYVKGLGTEWKIAAVGDLDGNGTDDIIVRHDAGFTGAYMIGTDGKITWSNLDTLKSDMTIVGTGDFNGDGVDDVLLQNKSNGWVGAWLVEDGSVDSFIGICKNKNAIEQIADFNGDGIDDLRIRTDKGDIGVLYVKGADTTEWKYFQSVGKEWDTSFALIS